MKRQTTVRPVGNTPRRATAGPRFRAGLSLMEMLIALTISATLLTSALVALDAMFKGYKETTESASTHVVSRLVMTRLLGLIRTGSDFGPYPANVLDANANPLGADYIEFVSARDESGAPERITRIEWRPADGEAPHTTWGVAQGPPDDEEHVEEDPEAGEGGEIEPGGEAGEDEAPESAPGELWYVLIEPGPDGGEVLAEHPLMRGVTRAVFTLTYDIGPRLTRATIDLTVAPNDSIDLTIGGEVPATIRLVASATPRQTLED